MTVITCLGVLWFIGASIKLVLLWIQYRRMSAVIKKMEPCKDKDIMELLQQICDEQKIRNRFVVIKMEVLKSPFVLGFVHPTIFLPKYKLKRVEWEFILLHEIAHFYNHDLWKKLFFEIVCAFYWWNPLLILLKEEFSNIIELKTDEFVTRDLDEKKKVQYLECLIKIAKENKGNVIPQNSTAFYMKRGNNLECRFRFIANECQSKKRKYSLVGLFLGMILFFSSFMFLFEAYKVTPFVEESTFEISTQNAYILLQDGQYYMCIDGEEAVPIDEIKDSYSELLIYKEDKVNEKQD
ncbi:MAG: M56 family metallopeptidase [Lachnospiraceae bacterium]|nr:M56 family metallopeptidase [Lachnospiraceae bacterium]